MRTFYLHFNRIAMQRGDPKVWSIRTSKGCFHTSTVLVDVPLATVFKSKGRQPRAFLRGVGNGYWLEMDNGETWMLLTNKRLRGNNDTIKFLNSQRFHLRFMKICVS